MTRRTSRLPPPEAYAARRAAAAAGGAAVDEAAERVVPAPGPDPAAVAPTPEAAIPEPKADAVHPAPHGHRRAFEGRRRPRLLWAGATLLAAAAVVVGVVFVGGWRPSLRFDLTARTALGSTAPTAASAVADPGGAGSVPIAGAAAPSAVRAAVTGALAARAKAVLAGDADAIAATSSGTDVVFDAGRLAALPITGWHYADPRVTTTADAGRYDVSATLDYRLAGEPAATGASLDLVVAEGTAGWRVVSERSHDGVLPWELGPLRVVTGDRTVVVGVGATPEDTAALRGWARDGDAAVAAIRAVVPEGWPGRLTLVVPASSEQAAALTGRTVESLQGLAAVTVAAPEPAGGSGVRVFRVFVDTPLVTGMSEQARRILLRHEVTHVATGAPATGATPLWLEEGLAQYLGYRGSGVPLSVAVQDLRGQRLPARPPAADAFSGAGAAAAYEAAHVLCAVMAERVGERGLLRVYRRTAAGAGFAAAWRATGQGTESSLLSAWQARMRAEAAAA